MRVGGEEMGRKQVELFVHLVWGTMLRRPMITPDIEADAYGVVAAKTWELRCTPVVIGGTADHLHLLARFPSTVPVARLVGEVKGASSHFINHRLGQTRRFAWQSGFGAFTIATDDVPALSSYIREQKVHHARQNVVPMFELSDSDATSVQPR
ncbi:MAG: transposase [Deltaproteobacteria bacterium]|nr:transposase [Deltaproteobacteria bacterium]